MSYQDSQNALVQSPMGVGLTNRVVSITEQFKEEKVRLEARLAELTRGLELVERNPDLVEILKIIQGRNY